MYLSEKKLFGDCAFHWDDGDERLVVFFLLELNDAVAQGIEGVVFTHADILARVVLRATLTDDDVASDGCLSTENLNSESLASGLTTVLGTTDAFLVCHIFSVFFGFYITMLSITTLLKYWRWPLVV